MLDWREQQQSAHLSGVNAACRVAFQQLRCDSPNEKWGVSEKTQLPPGQSGQFCELAHRGQGRTERNCFSWEMWLHVFPHLPYRQADFCRVLAFPAENSVRSFPNLRKAFCLFHFHWIARRIKGQMEETGGMTTMDLMNNMQHSPLSRKPKPNPFSLCLSIQHHASWFITHKR